MSSVITLRTLQIDDENEFFIALNDDWENHFEFAPYFSSLAKNNFKNYVNLILDLSLGKHLPANHVPCTLLFAFNEENKIVGRSSIRHTLNENLLQVGGHIGYGVCPTYRRQGHATSILQKSLHYVQANLLHLKKVLVTCDDHNIGSIKTIEKNNGVLENIVTIKEEKKRRYWIGL